ncbi:rod shape-determining protein MreC [Patescibacteria group bacterium]|nr:rod shape-determining protein MreC [Patescibacteria group bacterium]
MKKRFIIFFILSLFLNFTDRVMGLDGAKRKVGVLVNPLQLGMVEARMGVQEAFSFLSSLPLVYRENLQLQESLIKYQEIEIENLELMQENIILREQMEVDLPQEWMLEPVKVVGFTEKAGERLVLVRGQASQGQAVVLGRRLIGEVVSTTGLLSQVRTIYSAESRVAVSIVGKEEIVEALAEGKFVSEVYAVNILAEKEVNVGDLVVTSGAAGKYPRGLVIGEIEDVSEESGEVYKIAKVKLSWSLRQLKTVFVM